MINNKIDYDYSVRTLNKATKYYDDGHPIMSDAEWDKLYFDVKKFEDSTGIRYTTSPTQRVDFSVVSKLNKVQHNHPMLSLAKTKDIEEIKSFIGNKSYVAMSKMDGLTCSLRYVNGRLVSAETRGNGVIGEDVLHNIIHAHGVPYIIYRNGEYVIDGEIICRYEDFEPFSNEYRNPRNFASGSIRLLDSNESAKRALTFVAWDCISPIADTLTEKLNMLKDIGFIVAPYSSVNPDYDIEYLKSEAERLSYPTDGIVFKYNDCKYYDSLGNTDHHFRGGIAYKFYDDLYSTNLINITYDVSRNGVLTPVAIFEPVEIDGTIVSKASLHNLSIMMETLGKHPYVGQKIEVYKANLIIPQIYSADKDSSNVGGNTKFITLPDACPICGQPVEISKDNNTSILICTNELCGGKLINRIEHFCSKEGLDIVGLSDRTIDKLVGWGYVKRFSDLFKLNDYSIEWSRKDGFSVVSVGNILSSINKSSETTLAKFITAIGISGIGKKQADLISSVCNSYQDFRNKVDSGFDWSSIDDFGKVTRDTINSFNYDEADACIPYIVIKEKEIKKIESDTLSGIKVVITGTLSMYKNRNELKEDIERHGGIVVDNVTKTTNYLINNDTESESTKNKKAKSLNIPIISEKEFKEKFLV